MKRSIALLFLLTLVPCAAFAQAYSATLNGAQEVPGPGDADGVGLGVFTIDGTTLRYSVWTQNFAPATAAHIHIGAPGVAGDPVVTLDVNALANGVATITAALADQIRADPAGYYVNVHTGDFPNGAIRGQLTSASASGEGTSTAFIPVVGKVAGQNNTNFVTDLRIINTGATTATVTLDYFAQSGAGQSAPTATGEVTVLPGAQAVLNDVVFATLGVTSGLGGLRIAANGNVVSSARVINDLRADNRGTSGFAVDARETGTTSGTIPFLSSNPDYRTNIGYFNPAAAPVTATFVARRSSDGAVLGSSSITIAGYAMVQQPAFNLINTVPVEQRTQNDYYVTWTSHAPLFVYGAVTDNRTGDAVLNE